MSGLAVGVSMLELEEFLMSSTAARAAASLAEDEIRDLIRGAMHNMRFMMFTWLMQNGVALPVHLINDELHVRVGSQTPDNVPSVPDDETLEFPPVA